MSSKWIDVCDGYGIEEIPSSMSKGLYCNLCSPEFKNRKLYTSESLQSNGTVYGYESMINKVRKNCYCKSHILYLYQN